jgi:hypothetical protein
MIGYVVWYGLGAIGAVLAVADWICYKVKR